MLGDEGDIDHKLEDENYFVSMTDMMAGLVFVFIILLMYYVLQLHLAETAYRNTTEQIVSADATRAEILQNIQERLRQQGLKVEIDTLSGVLRLPDEVLFDSAKTEIKPEGITALQKLGDALEAVLPCYTDRPDQSAQPSGCPPATHHIESLFVEGHTDKDPLMGNGLIRDNWDLSVVRATNTFRKLTGLDPRLKELCLRRESQCIPILSVSGYESERPVATGDDPASKAMNRRIDLRILMESPRPTEVEQALHAQLGSAR